MATTNNPLCLDLDTMYEPTDIEENVFDLLTAYLPPDSTITLNKQLIKPTLSSHIAF